MASILVFVCLASAAMHFEIVARIATDVPIWDEWGVLGRNLLPRYVEGSLQAADLFHRHNEHRILSTHITDLGLFALNGQWDPIVKITFNILLRTCCVGALVVLLCRGLDGGRRWLMALMLIVAFIPVADWHNVIWGFQSQVWFALGFAVITISCLSGHGRLRTAWGCVFCLAAMLSMGAGYMLPFALIASGVCSAVIARKRPLCVARISILTILAAVAVFLRGDFSDGGGMSPASLLAAVIGFGRMLGWPHDQVSMAAVAMNAPMIGWLYQCFRKRSALSGEQLAVLTLWLWAVTIALGASIARGGSVEFRAGVPSRYTDFVVLLPLANVWALLKCADPQATGSRHWRSAALIWFLFFFVGFVGVFSQTWRQIVLPRIRDPEGPVRVAVAFQRTRNPLVFFAQPRLYIPYPTASVIEEVLDDPRLAGKLPPSFQPKNRIAWLGRICRCLFRAHWFGSLTLGVLSIAGLFVPWQSRVSRAPRDESQSPA